MNNPLLPIKTGFTIFFTMLLFISYAQATAADSVTFAERYALEQIELKQTGTAVFKWAFLFDVYAGAFYLPEGVAGSEWTKNLPKRLELSYFRNFSAKDFSSSSDRLLRENLPAEEYQSLSERLQQFYRLFRDINPGDRYSLTYRPATGTELRLNDQLLGAVPGADFAVAYFGIWLGPQPIDKMFRDRLLKGHS